MKNGGKKVGGKTLRKLEYEQIIKMLAERCSSGLEKNLPVRLIFLDLEEIRKWLAETTEAKELLF